MSTCYLHTAKTESRKLPRLSFWIASAVLLGGCVPLPMPGSIEGGISDEAVRRIQPGTTTRADVLSMLGNPAERLENDSAFVFEWWQSYGSVAFVTGGPGAAGPVATTGQVGCHALAIQFGPDGVVTRAKVIHSKKKTSTVWFSIDMPRPSCTSELAAEVKAWLDEPPKNPP
ncbi:MAG TPA: hypothetical protein VEG36_01280 [Burkholderiales bacterium]|nr:hypothetical protein [Burkholderiales bacterium]